MGRRIGQVAGGLAFVMLLGRLGRLLETGPLQPNWQLILAAAAFLGGVGWWLLTQMTSNTTVRLVVFGVAGLLLALRIIAADTLNYVFLPGPETINAIGAEMELALRTIRSGVPPVLPRPGVLAVLSLVMWAIGALYTWGSTRGPHGALWLPSLVMYLQFAVWDRKEVLSYWLIGTSLVLSLGIVSLALERRGESGRARDTEGRPMPRRAVGVAVAITAVLSVSTIALANTAKDFVSEYGNLPWRSDGGGFGDGPGGGISFDGLVGLRQRVINRSNTPVFTARITGDLPETGAYWRMQTLDVFEGDEWTSNSSSRHYQPGQPLASQDDVYQGTTYDLLQRVKIQNLSSDLAPTLGVPLEVLTQDDKTDLRDPTEFNMFPAGEIAVMTGLAKNDQYVVRTRLGDRKADLGALATVDGQLSRLFQRAAEQGDFPYSATFTTEAATPPPDLEFYTQLPDNNPAAIGRLARQITEGASTDFEKAWLLQSWFRETGDFKYDTDVSTGHGSLVLEDWLTDSTSQNYRTGYCEQFAASMGVMLRALDVPTRVVWGFTPGSAEPIADGVVEITVLDTNAHAWVEVFVEPYGWFPFDPTPRSEFVAPSITAGFDAREMVPSLNESPIATPDPLSRSNFGGEALFGDPDTPTVSADGFEWWLFALLAIPIVIAAVPITKATRRRRRMARLKEGDVTAAWDEIVDRLTDLGEVVPDTMTPLEVAQSKDNALVPLARSYSAAVYGGRNGHGSESDLTGVEWWINREYDTSERLIARFSWRSLFKR